MLDPSKPYNIFYNGRLMRSCDNCTNVPVVVGKKDMDNKDGKMKELLSRRKFSIGV